MVNELKWTSITNSQVEREMYRLEASVFNVDTQQAKENIKLSKHKTVAICGAGGLSTAYVGLRFKRVFVKNSDLAIFQPSQITDVSPKAELFISKRTKTNIESLRVHTGQILMTCSGTIGKVALVSKSLNNKIFSHDLIRINANDPEDAGFIYTFFKTKTGNSILTTNNYGAVIQHIEPEHLNNVTIPYPSAKIRKSIHDKIIRSYELRDESNEMMNNSEKLLLGSLSLSNFDDFTSEQHDSTNTVSCYTVSLNDLDNRFEGSYHVPIVSAIIDRLLDGADKILRLGDKQLASSVFLPGRFKRYYVEEGKGSVFIGGKQISEIDPSGKKYLSNKIHGSRIESELFLHQNMIIITRSGTVGKVNIVPKHWENWVANDHILRVTPANQDVAGYLYTWLNSEYGRVLIKRFTYGAVVDEIDNNHLSNVPVPILKNSALLKKINDMALRANDLRTEAYNLEQLAIKEMNSKVLFVI